MSSGSSKATREHFGYNEAGPVTLEVHQCTKGPQISHQSASPRGRGAECHSAVLGHCPPIYIILKTAQHLKFCWKNIGLGIQYIGFPSFHSRRRRWHPTLVLLPGKSHGRRLQSMGSLRVGHDWATSLSLFSFMHWRRKWQPTPAFLPGESQGQGSLVGCHLRGCTESDTTEVTQPQQQCLFLIWCIIF